MTARTTKASTSENAKAATKDKAVASFPDPPDKLTADALAVLALQPDAMAAVAVQPYTNAFGKLDVSSLAMVLAGQIKAVQGGEMKHAEAMLYGQAQALQAMFTSLARRASSQDYIKNMETYLRMALKAQNQCRMTLETLATIKNPPVVFARQMNVANGPQQVNNGTVQHHAVSPEQARADAGTHTTKQNLDQIGLLEVGNGQRLDTRTPGTAGSADPHLAPVGEVHRPTHCRGQGHGGAQQ